MCERERERVFAALIGAEWHFTFVAFRQKPLKAERSFMLLRPRKGAQISGVAGGEGRPEEAADLL